MPPMKQIAALASCLILWFGQAVAAPQAVQVPTAGVSSAPAPLSAFVFSPQSTGKHAAVVMVHGCGGAYGKDGQLSPRHAMWGEYLASQGYVALMLDSFSARGVAQICTIKYSERTIREADRVGDAYAALAYLRQLPNVDANRIALLGWSHGGGVVLGAITQRPQGAGFNAAVSFYPGCTSRNKKADSFQPYAPLLLLIGEADDWTPAEPCKALAATVAARGEPMQIVTYPDTYHDFDNPALKTKRVRKDVPNGVNPGAGVTTAPNPQASEDAKLRVKNFFAEHLQ
jgi:dienelactone hydrolase